MHTIYIEDKSKHLPPKLLDALHVGKGAWIAGGAARCLFLGSPLNDIDVWYPSEKLWQHSVQNINRYRVSSPYETDNATTVTVSSDWSKEATETTPLVDGANTDWVGLLKGITSVFSDNTINEYKVQMIKKKYYTCIEEIFNDFDFSVCKVATDGQGQFTFDEQALEDIAHQRLRCTRYSPEGFLTRFIKYNIYGYKMPKEELKHYLSLPDLDWKVKDDSTLY